MKLITEVRTAADFKYPPLYEYRLPVDRDGLTWFQERFNQMVFTFRNPEPGFDLVNNSLRQAVQMRDENLVHRVLKQIDKNTIKSSDRIDIERRWDDASLRKIQYCSGDAEQFKRYITAHAKGRVLEAMCGYRSYIDDVPHIREVVALDLSPAALMLHDHPQRARYQCDLEVIVEGERLDFPDSHFDTVSVTLGEGYLSDRVAVYREFHRLLVPGGNLVVAGGTGREDIWTINRSFSPGRVKREMRTAGFNANIYRCPIRVSPLDSAKYYIVDGKKRSQKNRSFFSFFLNVESPLFL